VNILAELRRRRCKAESSKRQSADHRPFAAAAMELSSADRRRNCGGTPADVDVRVAVPTGAQRRASECIAWLPDEPTPSTPHRRSSSADESSPTSPSRPLSRCSQNDQVTLPPPLPVPEDDDDDDIVFAPAAPDDVARKRVVGKVFPVNTNRNKKQNRYGGRLPRLG